MSSNEVFSGGGGTDESNVETRTVTEDAGQSHEFGNVKAVIGPIEFKDGLHDPDVNVVNKRETSDHEIVTGHDAYRNEGAEYVVQALGRRPTELQITGWITANQLELADNLVSNDRVNVITARWTGIAVPEQTDVTYSRTYHDTHGWIFETTFDLFGVARGQLLEEEEVVSVSGIDLAEQLNQ